MYILPILAHTIPVLTESSVIKAIFKYLLHMLWHRETSNYK